MIKTHATPAFSPSFTTIVVLGECHQLLASLADAGTRPVSFEVSPETYESMVKSFDADVPRADIPGFMNVLGIPVISRMGLDPLVRMNTIRKDSFTLESIR